MACVIACQILNLSSKRGLALDPIAVISFSQNNGLWGQPLLFMSSELGLTSLIGSCYIANKRYAGSKVLPFLTSVPSVSQCGYFPWASAAGKRVGMRQDESCNQSSRSVAITAGARQGSGGRVRGTRTMVLSFWSQSRGHILLGILGDTEAGYYSGTGQGLQFQ